MSRRFIEYFAAGTTGQDLVPDEGDTTSSIFRANKGQLFLKTVAKDFVSSVERIQRDDPKRKKIALVATAHYLIRVMQAMLRTGEVWQEENSQQKAA